MKKKDKQKTTLLNTENKLVARGEVDEGMGEMGEED